MVPLERKLSPETTLRSESPADWLPLPSSPHRGEGKASGDFLARPARKMAHSILMPEVYCPSLDASFQSGFFIAMEVALCIAMGE